MMKLKITQDKISIRTSARNTNSIVIISINNMVLIQSCLNFYPHIINKLRQLTNQNKNIHKVQPLINIESAILNTTQHQPQRNIQKYGTAQYQLIQMGNLCDNSHQQPLILPNTYEYANDTSGQNNNSKLEANLRNYSNQVPEKQFAQRVLDRRPKLTPAIDKVIATQIATKPIQRMKWKGVPLPMFFITEANSFYEGEWRLGYPNGYGKAYFEDGSYYQGSFTDGYPHGVDGIFIYPNGSFKRGQIRKGALEGKGKFVSNNGTFIYDGFWLNDKPHGEGIETYNNGCKYQGTFVNGIKQGDHCIYTWPDGKMYMGAFKDGFMHGHGKLKMTKGKGEYEGLFQRNLIVGPGKMRTQKGLYEGNFVNGEMGGIGKFTLDDGRIYEGEFRNGQICGKGVFKLENGDQINVDRQVQESEL